ncbi:MAG: tripartite tricarboxylate transporter substrate-binding protein [Burkholderiales bacterium]
MSGWTPADPLRLIVGSRPGGANDVFGRMLVQGLSEAGGPEISIVNIPGDEMAKAWKALQEAEPDGHTIGTSSNVLLTSFLAGKSKLHYSGYTSIALLVEETMAMAVADAAVDWPGLLRRPRLRAGFIGSPGNARHLALATALVAQGHDMAQVEFRGCETEQECMRELAAGQSDVYCNTASAVAALVRAGTVRPVAVSAKNRLPGVYKDTPCLSEFGVREPFTAWRAIIGPPGMPAPAVAYWVETFRALSGTPAWTRRMEEHHWNSRFLETRAFAGFLDTLSADLERCLAAIARRA